MKSIIIYIKFINVRLIIYTMEQKIVLEVRENKGNGQKYINIPKRKGLNEGDYVVIKKIVNNNKEDAKE